MLQFWWCKLKYSTPINVQWAASGALPWCYLQCSMHVAKGLASCLWVTPLQINVYNSAIINWYLKVCTAIVQLSLPTPEPIYWTSGKGQKMFFEAETRQPMEEGDGLVPACSQQVQRWRENAPQLQHKLLLRNALNRLQPFYSYLITTEFWDKIVFQYYWNNELSYFHIF